MAWFPSTYAFKALLAKVVGSEICVGFNAHLWVMCQGDAGISSELLNDHSKDLPKLAPGIDSLVE